MAAESVSAVPPTPTGLPAAIEALAEYVPANSCDASPKPGATAFAEMLRANSGIGYGIARACGSDSLSTTEHYDGRAVDWSVTIRNATSNAKATEILNWLMATDARGNQYANARRLGIMYIIWNNKIWGSYRAADGWREYNNCSATPSTSYDTTCHRNHIHFSLSWEGANKRTSWWTKAVAKPEYGPCRVPDLNWAPPSSAARYTSCPSYPKVTAAANAPANAKTLVNFSGMYVRQGSTGPVVKAIQTEIGAATDGSFGPATLSALKSWQTSHGVPASGVSDVATWRAMIAKYRSGATPPPKPVVAGTRSDASIWTYGSTGKGTLAAGQKVGGNWSGYRVILSAGDVNGDGWTDVLGVTTAGAMWLHRSDGWGGYAPRTTMGGGWTFPILASGGDLTGDGRVDLLARRTDGSLYLYAAAGGGTFSAGRSLGRGWDAFSQLASAGDLNGDKRPELLAITPAGQMYTYPANGSGGFAARYSMGRGWNSFNALLGVGDVNGDAKSDLVTRGTDGRLYLYPGNGAGAFAARTNIGTGWQVYTTLADVH